MILQVPDTVAAQADCSASELLFGMIVGLFYQGRLSLGQAGEAVGLSKPDMMRKLNERGLPMPYSAEDATHDLAVIDQLLGQGNSNALP